MDPFGGAQMLENAMKTKGFGAFGPLKGGRFWDHFWAPSFQDFPGFCRDLIIFNGRRPGRPGSEARDLAQNSYGVFFFRSWPARSYGVFFFAGRAGQELRRVFYFAAK